jgi:hypothetical protein
MPILKFLHTNQALKLHREKGVDTSSLWFDATIKCPHDFHARFKIFCPGEECDVQLERRSHDQAGRFKKRVAVIPAPWIPMTRLVLVSKINLIVM